MILQRETDQTFIFHQLKSRNENIFEASILSSEDYCTVQNFAKEYHKE